MLTNDELKKKIAQIIADYFCPQRNEHKSLWGDDRLCYSKMNFAECERVTECTDALIKAGIGDVKDLQAQVDVLEITNIALEAGYNDAEKDRLYWVDKYKEAEHRAEVAEDVIDEFVEKLKNQFDSNGNLNTAMFGWNTSEIKMLIDLSSKNFINELSDEMRQEVEK